MGLTISTGLGEVMEMKDSQLRDFCLALMKADTEEEVIALMFGSRN